MNSIQPQDSLDNLSNLQLNRHRQLQAQVKQQFTRALEKLQLSQTRQIGISEIKKLVEQYREQQFLRGYIAILKSLKANGNSATKQHEILVTSILAQTYKQQLLDPIDKPPSLLKTSFRLVEILHSYFNDHSPTVQQACARALLDLNTHCLFDQSIETVFSIIYAPLISVLKSGVERGSQATASACLSELINFNRRKGNEEILKKLSPEMLSAILKVSSEYHELFQAVLGLLQSQGLNFLEGKIVNFLSKIKSVIDGTRETRNSTNLNAYMCKVNVCKMIEKIGRLLPLPEKEKLYELRIPESLQQAARHRIIQVQLAASKALKAWRGEQIDDSPPKSRGLSSLEEKRNSKKRQRSSSKQERMKAQSELTFMKEDLQKMVKGGWGANNRAKNYVKRGTGVGGGHISQAQLSPQSNSVGKSHKEHLQQLRQFIKKGAQQNRHIDHFVGLVGSQFEKINRSPQSRSKSPPARSPVQKKKSNKSRSPSGGDEFGFQQDVGEQMVYQAKPQKVQKNFKTSQSEKRSNPVTRKNRFDDIGMSQDEVMQLMHQEKALLQQGRQMNINYTQVSQDKTPEPVKPEIKENEPKYIPVVDNPYLPEAIQFEERPKRQENLTFKGISQTELGQLIQENNLSQVSQNLNGILSESDMKAFEQSKVAILDSRILEPTQGKSEIGALKEVVAQKKQKRSTLSKFMKKDTSEIEQFKDRSHNPPKQNLDHQAVSLAFTQSQQSKSKSPGKRQDIQFTLNPKERFSTLHDPIKKENEGQVQVEEEIAMSQYYQSFPHQHPLPVILPKVAPITQTPLRHSAIPPILERIDQYSPNEIDFRKVGNPPYRHERKVEEKKVEPAQTKVDYQNIIKNPPRLQNLNETSKFKSSKITSEKSYNQKSRYNNDKTEDIGENWLNILDKVNQQEMNDAYEEVLSLDDPIYLLRLMLLSKLPVKKLSPDAFQNVWKKFIEIYSQKFIDVLTVGLLDEANDLDILTKSLSVEELQDAMVGLYQLSGSSRGKLSYKAATLYNEVDKKLHPE